MLQFEAQLGSKTAGQKPDLLITLDVQALKSPRQLIMQLMKRCAAVVVKDVLERMGWTLL